MEHADAEALGGTVAATAAAEDKGSSSGYVLPLLAGVLSFRWLRTSCRDLPTGPGCPSLHTHAPDQIIAGYHRQIRSVMSQRWDSMIVGGMHAAMMD